MSNIVTCDSAPPNQKGRCVQSYVVTFIFFIDYCWWLCAVIHGKCKLLNKETVKEWVTSRVERKMIFDILLDV